MRSVDLVGCEEDDDDVEGKRRKEIQEEPGSDVVVRNLVWLHQHRV